MPLVWVNGGSIAYYLLLFLIIRKEQLHTAFLLINCEICIFTMIAVILTGDWSNYSLYCVSTMPAICLYYYYRQVIQKKTSNVITVFCLCMVILFFIAENYIDASRNMKYLLPIEIVNFIGNLNAFVLTIFIAGGSIILLYLAILNSRRLEKALNETDYAAQHDYLTGLKNRKSMESFIKRLNDSNRNYALLLGDLDKFKSVNDTYGHDCGDYILKTISVIIKESISNDYRVYRWGGEELILILPEVSPEKAYFVAEHIRKRIENYVFEYKNKQIHVTLTLGISMSRKRELAEVEREADACLYHGKARGRNCVVTWEMMRQ